MESRLIKIQKMESIKIPKKLLEAVILETEQEKAVQKLREHYQTIETVDDRVRKGDFVVIEQNNIVQCYNTARNFTQSDLINNCMDQKSGKTILSADGGSGKIIAVKRKVLPPFDDTLAQKAGMESARECRKKIITELTEKKRKWMERELVEYLTGQIVKLSEYAFCPEEIAKHTADMKREFEVMAKEQGRVLLDCVEDFLPVFGIEEKEHKTAEAYLEEMCIKQMKIILLGNEYLKEFHVILGKEQYEKEISRIMKKEEMSREEAEQQYSYESFLYNKCLAQVENAMRKYIKTQIKIKIMVEE